MYESELSSFSLVTFGFVFFGTKIWHEKCMHKMLMKLTPDVVHWFDLTSASDSTGDDLVISDAKFLFSQEVPTG